MTELIIKIDIIYFLGIMISLIGMAWYGGHRFGGIETSIKAMKDELARVWSSIAGLDSRIAGAERGRSPIQPTELGGKWLTESGLGKIIDEEKKELLLQTLRSLLPQSHSDYDVQETARRVMVSFRDDPIMVGAKQYAFNNGIDVDMLLRVGGLLLRDNFLGRPHQIIPTSEANKQPT